MSDRGISADELARSARIVGLAEQLDALVDSIDAKILRAHEMGLALVDHSLPTHFDFGNITLARAQILVYSEILAIYERKGFVVKLTQEDDGRVVKIILKWSNGISADEFARRKKKIDDALGRR